MMPNQASSNSAALQSVALRAMNTDIEIMLECEKENLPAQERLAQIWFQSMERQFSRFRPDSELTHINTTSGKPTLISELMLEVLLLAENYRKITQGVFNPLILKALENAGYNASFEKLQSRFLDTAVNRNRNGNDSVTNNSIARDFPKASSDPDSETLALVLDPQAHSVQLSAGTKIDLGGIAKSWAVKRLVHEYQNEFKLKRGFVNAGGDLSVWGSSTESGEPWLIGIENPWQPSKDMGTLALENGSVATSSKFGRQWSGPQSQMHHLIDPNTMQPSHSDVVQCTVTGPDVIECEIWTKVICILGLEKGLHLFTQETNGNEAVIFTMDKETHFYGKDSLQKAGRDLTIQHFIRCLPATKTPASLVGDKWR